MALENLGDAFDASRKNWTIAVYLRGHNLSASLITKFYDWCARKGKASCLAHE